MGFLKWLAYQRIGSSHKYTIYDLINNVKQYEKTRGELFEIRMLLAASDDERIKQTLAYLKYQPPYEGYNTRERKVE